MLKRRDIPPVLLLLLLIVLVMLTLSQILVVHNGRHKQYGRSVHNIRKLQIELREMDINLHSLMLQNVPSIELNRRLLQNQINAERIAAIIRQASVAHPPSSAGRWNNQSNAKSFPLLPSSERHLLRLETRAWKATTQHSSPVLNKLVRNAVTVPTGKTLPLASPASPASVVRESDKRIAEPATLLITQQDVRPRNTLSAKASTRERRTGMVGSEQRIAHARSTSTARSPPRSRLAGGTKTPGDAHRQHADPALRNTFSHKPNQPIDTSARQTDESARRNSPSGEEDSSKTTNNGTDLAGTPANAGNHSKPLLNYCPSIPPNLRGNMHIRLDRNYTESEIEAANPRVQSGGVWRPSRCMARHKVAIIIPYRDRQEHLSLLLYHLHPMLQKQQLDYTIFVVEQSGNDTFNKARIMNIAFVEALKLYAYQCFVFHDVDLVPEDDRNMYSCPPQPRHLSVAIDNMGYKLAYPELVGGVLNMRTEHFMRVNGYSNLYWGWGAEDDDMANRIMHVGLKITRPVENVARFKMAKHTKRKPADYRKRAKLLYTGTRRFQFDGLNSLQYTVDTIRKRHLYTHITVDIGSPPNGF